MEMGFWRSSVATSRLHHIPNATIRLYVHQEKKSSLKEKQKYRNGTAIYKASQRTGGQK